MKSRERTVLALFLSGCAWVGVSSLIWSSWAQPRIRPARSTVAARCDEAIKAAEEARDLVVWKDKYPAKWEQAQAAMLRTQQDMESEMQDLRSKEASYACIAIIGGLLGFVSCLGLLLLLLPRVPLEHGVLEPQEKQ
ncbi:MAG: hypothetical protein KA184_21315 [Candidatus Hydrogenedentes bacterium]|nr:hypothetical protein [Candidatus Hydrogenedentota bacterium]